MAAKKPKKLKKGKNLGGVKATLNPQPLPPKLFPR